MSTGAQGRAFHSPFWLVRVDPARRPCWLVLVRTSSTSTANLTYRTQLVWQRPVSYVPTFPNKEIELIELILQVR